VAEPVAEAVSHRGVQAGLAALATTPRQADSTAGSGHLGTQLSAPLGESEPKKLGGQGSSEIL